MSLYNSKENIYLTEKNEIIDSLKDRNILKEVREYWNKKTDDNEFNYNVKNNFKLIDVKEGLLAYAVWEYMREAEDFTGKKQYGERIKHSEYIGEKGNKILNREVVISNISSFDSFYGTTFIISMIDENDDLIVWKTSSPDGEKNERRTIKTAIIKDHNEYKGIKQTIVKNLKFMPID